MKERLTFTIENNKIAELFGKQNFASKEVAILELIKNSYDAGANFLNIKITKSEITIVDNGFGMSKDTIRNKWMAVGVSDKKYNFIAVDDKYRVFSGSKGIGRFALARLGKNIELFSKTKNSDGLRWITDWNENLLDDFDINTIGTTIKITNLNDSWSEREVEKLSLYISSFKDDEDLAINLFFEDKRYNCENVFNDVRLGNNALSEILFRFNSEDCSLNISINSVEFDKKAQVAIDLFNNNPDNKNKIIAKSIYKYEKNTNVLDDISFDQDLSFVEKNKNLICSVGSFSGAIYFNNNYNVKGAQDFYYSWPKTVEEFPDNAKGLFLFRNAFCISGYSGNDDWLGLRKRVRKSPAAATHKTGKWRIRDNQISGKISIDKEENKNIIELQNRQGIEDNVSFNIFKFIVCDVLSVFEEYRQSIIRVIDVKNINHDSVKFDNSKKVIDKYINNPKKILEISEREAAELASGIKTITEEIHKEKAEYERKKIDLDYANRLLNSLSTVGLKSASIAHELNNKRNNISNAYEYIVSSLQKYGFWDILTDNSHTRQKVNNVPMLLNDVKEINEIVIHYIDSMLETVDKKKFLVESFAVCDVMIDITNRWKEEYSWLSFDLSIDKNIFFCSSKDVFETIFNNLILNSLQQNEKKENILIGINIKKAYERLDIVYTDDGVGLPEKYATNPFKILEPHETSRVNGHGLGMWILYSVVLDNGGEILDIKQNNGFGIKFYIKEKNNGQD